ncbi:Low affinity sodium-glucose cotransporter [Fasciola hepatica]|uniref:Low affinity sodium-glucose cotransporter n=1 Tax=Fasciola hepatica TaxID=6192 RepID=A0A4E0S037_FASHE|nr:Low affinity sodium-glucose cotransporter [Fasciola hepatica]
MPGVRIDGFDVAVLVIYFVGVLIAGFALLKVGASLFASNIGSEHFIGLSGSGAASGFGVGAFELNATILLQLLGWVFLPVYISSGVCTLPEFMMKRFGGSRIQIYLSGLSLLLYVFTKISVNLYSGALFLAEAINWNIWWSIFLQLSLTTAITVLGGLAAVMYTDTLQFFVMITGAVLLAILSFVRVGGFSGLLAAYGSSIAYVNASTTQGSQLLVDLIDAYHQTNGTTLIELAGHSSDLASLKCGLPSPKAFRLLREINDPDMPWLGFLLGQTPASIWYWCADQMMVQRALAAKSLSHAQGATLMAGAIKILPFFIIVVPGMISRVLFPDEIACLPGDDCFEKCGQRSGCADMAYPKLVFGIMPSGLRGLMLAVMLAALISDLTSIFNSASTLFTMDVYKRFRKQARDSELVLIGRVFVIFLVAVSILWVPVIQRLQGGQLYMYIQGVAACLAPPIAAVYLLTILWRRSTEPGAFFALMTGLIVGLIRLVLTVVYHEPVCGEPDNRPDIVARLHYMYFAVLSFLLTTLVMIVVSLFTRPPDRHKLSRLTYFTAWDVPEEINRPDSKVCAVADAYDTPTGDMVINYRNYDATVTEQPQNTGIQIKDGVDDVQVRLRSLENTFSCQSPAGLCFRHLCFWLCGCEDRPCSPDNEAAFAACLFCGENHVPNWFPLGRDKSTEDRNNLKNEEAHLRSVISLAQDPRAKIGLRVTLVILLVIVVFLYIFLSVFFELINPGPLPVWLNGSTNVTMDMLYPLQLKGLITIHSIHPENSNVIS